MHHKIYVLCNFNGEVFCNNLPVFEINANCQQPKLINVENENEINIKIVPFQTQSNLAYITVSGKIDVKTMQTNCPNFQLYELSKDIYLLKIKENALTPNLSLPIYSKTFGKAKVSVFSNNKTYFLVEANSLTTQTEINCTCDLVESEVLKDYAIFTFYKKNKLKHILILNTADLQVIENCSASIVEINEETIKIMQPLNDMFHQAKVIKYSLQSQPSENPMFQTNSILSKADEYLILTKNPPKKFSKMQIPFAFLECVNAKNYKFAKSFCTESLKSKMQDEHLKMFFEDEFEILYFQIEPNVYQTIKNNCVNTFSFTLYDNKIDNISKQ